MADNSTWMGDILAPSIRLNQIVMPGSHDAGMSLGSSYAQTQDLDISAQLQNGARWFDLRFFIKNGDARTYHGSFLKRVQNRGWDTMITTAGESYDDIIQSVIEFLSWNPDEFLFLRFSKCAPKFWETLKKDVHFQFIEDGVHEGKLLFNLNTNLIDATVNDLRGKCIFLIEDECFGDYDLTNNNGFHELKKTNCEKKGKNRQEGQSDVDSPLHYCGAYSGNRKPENIIAEGILDRVLTAEINAEKKDALKKLQKNNTQDKKSVEHYIGDCGGDVTRHLFVLYWTSTGGGLMPNQYNVHDNTILLRETGPAINEYIKEIGAKIKQLSLNDENFFGFEVDQKLFAEEKYDYVMKVLDPTNAKDYFLPNVVMYDFINEFQSREIWMLNSKDLRNFVLNTELEHHTVEDD